MIAVLLVVISHLSLNPSFSLMLERFNISSVSEFGLTGVQIFFFISGYVVCTSCLREVNKCGYFSIRAFYVRRFFRIVPPLMIYIGFCLFMSHLDVINFSLQNAFWSTAYLCNTSFADCGWLGGHLWSLAFEEQFYIVFPIAFLLILTRILRVKYLILFVFSVCIAVIPLLYTVNWIGRTGFVVIYGLFVFGAMTAKNSAVLFPWIKGRALFLFALSIAGIFVLPGVVTQIFGIDSGINFSFIKYSKFLNMFLIPILVLASSDLKIRIWLENPSLSYLGRASYSIYLWQQFATASVFHVLSFFEYTLFLLLVLAWCLMSFNFIERPLIEFGRSASRRIQHRDSLSRLAH